MFLNGYSKEILRAAACKPGYQPLYCVARLQEDISEVLPYLNRALGATGFSRQPPAMMLEYNNRQIAISAREITISPVEDGVEAEKILAWLQQKINEVWEKRDTIAPRFEADSAPRVFDVLRLLPKTNCRECGLTTCMIFANHVVEGKRGPEDCPQISDENRQQLIGYLKSFHSRRG